MKIKFYIVLFLAALITWSSCKRDPNKPRWNTNVLTPIASSTLSLNNLVADSLIHINADSTVTLVYKNPLYTFSLDSLIIIPDTTLPEISYGLNALNLGNQSISYKISLGQILDSAGYGPLIPFINHTWYTIPPIPPTTPTTNYLNVDSVFHSMTLDSGHMVIKINNNLPITIDNITFILRDSINGTLIDSAYFDSIPAHSWRADTADLAGKTVYGSLIANLSGVSSPGSAGVPVYIDTANLLILNMYTFGLKPTSATAVFPAQDIIRKTTIIPFHIRDVQLTEVIAAAGSINVDAYNTLPDTMFFTYIIPPARLNNVVFKAVGILLPAPDHDHPTVLHKSYDLTGYTLDLKGINENSYNTLYYNIVGSIDSTGQLQTLTTSDSLRIQSSFTGLVPSYARGYLGKDTIEFGPSSVPVTLFNHITSGTLNLNNVTLSLSVDNGIGADAKVLINNIQAVNTRTNQTKKLAPHGAGYQNPFSIARATETGNFNNPVNYVNSSLVLNSANSNDTSLINILPNQFNYDLTLYLDPNGNTNNSHDFIYRSSGINASLDLQVPLNFVSNQLTLVDTTAFSVGSSNQTGNISQGNFLLDVTNGFPLEGTIQMYLLNSNGAIVDSLFSTTAFAAPPIGMGGIVRETKFSRLTIPITEARMQNITKVATKAIIKVSFTTSNGNQNVKIYSDYKFGLKLIGDFTYKVE